MTGARIGVFVCHCGTNIGGFVDVPSVIDYVKSLPHVVYAEHNLYTCADDGLRAIKAAIKNYQLNRVVIAACTPRTHAPLFKSACREAGLNPYLFEFVNIRDQCSWVHMHEREAATEKAKDLIRMGVAKAELLEPDEDVCVAVEPAVLVIGGGVAGLTAAASCANQGFSVTLVEKEPVLGGLLRSLYKLYPTGEDAAASIAPLIERVTHSDQIRVLLSSAVTDVSGYIGNFDITVKSGETTTSFKVGTIIVATGASALEPTGLYGYGEFPHVVTQLQLEGMMKSDSLPHPRNVVMIQCVGARGQRVTYCSRVCCMTAIKNALLLKERFPDAQVTVLNNDIHVYGAEYEAQYRRAREEGIRFIKYSPRQPPKVGATTVSVQDELLGQMTDIPADLVVLSTPLVQTESALDLSKMLKVPLGQDKFFFEAHVKLRPVDFATDGIYLCGTAKGPADVTESVEQALAAASRAGIPMWNRIFSVEAMSSLIDPNRCIGCGICESLCPYRAIRTRDKKASSVKALCKGCGNCSAGCPTHAITMSHFSDEQIRAQMNSILDERGTGEPKIIAFCCNWCSYAGADLAGVSRFQYPPNTRIIRVMCSARVDPVFVFNALLRGAEGVLITGCHLQDCHYIDSNMDTLRRYRILEAVFRTYGMQDRIRLEWVSASEGERFATITKEFVERIRSLGPLTPEERELLSVLRHVFDGRKLRTVMNLARKNVAKGMDEAAYAEKVKKIALDEIEATRQQIRVHDKNRYPIYISGNIGDLKKHREAVWKALQEINVNVAGMEYFGERLDRSFEAAIAELAECKVIFVIIGSRYGKVDEETGKSAVEQEYEAALEHKLEVRCFLLQGEGGGVAPATGKHIQKLEALKARLQEKGSCTLFTDEQDLAKKVADEVTVLIGEGGIAARAPPQWAEAVADRPVFARGESPVIKGVVTGTPPEAIRIHITGNGWHQSGTVPVGSDGHFRYQLPANIAQGMPAGEYEARIQHCEDEEPTGKKESTVRVPFAVQNPFVTVDPVADRTGTETFTVSGTTNIGEDRELAIEIVPDKSSKKKFFPSESVHAKAKIRRGVDGVNMWSVSIDGSALRPQAYQIRVISDLGATAKTRFSIAWR